MVEKKNQAEKEKDETIRPAVAEDAVSQSARPEEGDLAADGDAGDRVRELEEKVARLESEVKSANERVLRERADLENFRKRTAREREEVLRYGNERLVKDLLSVIDNLERALEHASSGENGQPLIEGVTMVRGELVAVLERHGVSPVAALGERFDPARHEAVEEVESDDHEPRTVVREHQKGYMLRDRLIRPALVGVSRRGAGPCEKPESGGEKA